MDPRLTALKIDYKGEIHRVRINLTEYKFEDLKTLFDTTFALTETEYVIQFFDDMQQRFVVNDQASFETCVAKYLSNDKQNEASLRFVGQSKHSAALYEVTEPIVKAIEKLMEQLNQVMSKVQKKAQDEDWEGKCRRSLTATGVALQQAAMDARETLTDAKQKVQDFPYDEVVNDASEGIKMAAQEIKALASTFAETIADEFNTPSTSTAVTPEESVQTEEAPAQVETQAAEEVVPEPQVTQEAIAEPEQAADEEEWAVVEEDSRFAQELKVIREVFPDCDRAVTVALLEVNEGNVHAVLNAMAEM